MANWELLAQQAEACVQEERYGDGLSAASHALSLLPPASSSSSHQRLAALQLVCEQHVLKQASLANHAAHDYFASSALEVFESSAAGRGLRSTRRLLPGELLMVASPLVSSSSSTNNKADALQSMAAELVQCRDEHVLQCVYDLDDGTSTNTSSDAASPMDVKEVLKRNCFEVNAASYALYHMPSLLNHACASRCNLAVVFFGHTLVVRASSSTDIPAGSEVTIRYFPAAGMLLKERQHCTSTHWHFTCQCVWCLAEVVSLDALAALKQQEPVVCGAFFASEGDSVKLAKAWLALDELVGEVDKTLGSSIVRCGFLGAYQTHRACCEAVGGKEAAYAMQDRVIGLFDETEPGSFEHCKLLAVCVLFAEKHGDERRAKAMRVARDGVHRVRYGAQPLLLQHALAQTQAALLTRSPREWTLDQRT